MPPEGLIPPDGLMVPPPLASFVGFRSRTLMFFFVLGILIPYLFGLFVDVCMVSETPNNLRPPRTFFFGIRSSRRIIFSFLRGCL